MTDESQNPRNPAIRLSAGLPEGGPQTRPSPKEDQTPTIRTIPVELAPESLPDQGVQYAAPQPTPRMSEHKTIDMAPVRLAPEINPRNALTRRLAVVPVQRTGQGLLLGGVVAALVLAVLVLGVMRVLGPAASSGTTAATLPQEPALTAAAAITEPVVSAAALSTPPAQPETAPSAPTAPALKPAPLAAPKPTGTGKGREVWLE